jgi:ribose-phosphate pyrophosphokinase
MDFEFNEGLYYTTDDNPNLRVGVREWKFPDGSVGVDINTGSQEVYFGIKEVKLYARGSFDLSDKILAILFATDALRRHYPFAKIHLGLPYIPYARQDRVCNAGESLQVKVLCDLINQQNYESVLVVDPHSYVASALLDRVVVMDQYEVFKNLKKDWFNWTIVAPDQGAVKKCEDFAKRVGAKAVVGFSKSRELSTGKITGMKPLFDINPDESYLVLDDICDGGRTFTELVDFMSHCGVLELAVTHGIFSKGAEVVTRRFDRVHTTDSFQSHKDGVNVLKVLP